MYKNFVSIVKKAKELGPRRVAILFPYHLDIIQATAEGMKEGLIVPVLIGKEASIRSAAQKINLSLDPIELVDEEDPQKAANLCLDRVTKKDVSFIVKGNILTSYLYKGLIRVTAHLAPNQRPCTLCFHQVSGINKIFIITDPGVNIHPDLAIKEKLLENAIRVLRKMGCERPRVMVLAADYLDGTCSHSLQEAIILKRLIQEGKFGECEVTTHHNLYHEFPDRTISAEKFPDIFLVPNIETGNILVKSIDHLGLGIRQCVTVGAGIIVLTPSRSDGYETRLTNMALGVVLAAKMEIWSNQN